MPQSFNPVTRVEPVHGEETMGLGTSTFLEGAPASRKAIQRTQSDINGFGGDGLMRKKSLAQRIRGMSQSKGRYNEPIPSLREPLPTTRFQERNANGVTLMDGPVRSPDLPRPYTADAENRKPLDLTAHDDAYEKKSAAIKTIETKGSGAEEKEIAPLRQRSFSSPKRAAPERRVTSDEVASPGADKPSGFLSRVKSLKGPRKMKSDRLGP